MKPQLIIDYRDMVTRNAKNGEDILATLTAKDAHTMHMWVAGGELAELSETYFLREDATQTLLNCLKAVTNRPAELAAARAQLNLMNLALLKEMGDFSFYVTGLRIGHDMPSYDGDEARRVLPTWRHQVGTFDISRLLHETNFRLADLTDASKRLIIYRYTGGKVEEQRLRILDALDSVEFCFETLLERIGFTRAQVWEANITKLDKERYPNGYSDAAAAERADVAPGEDDLSKPAIPIDYTEGVAVQNVDAVQKAILVDDTGEKPAYVSLPPSGIGMTVGNLSGVTKVQFDAPGVGVSGAGAERIRAGLVPAITPVPIVDTPSAIPTAEQIAAGTEAAEKAIGATKELP